MNTDVISLEEAIAQGSTWKQMLSIAQFHEKAIAEETLNEDTVNAMPAWKAKVYRSALAKHRRIALHFRNLSDQLRAAA